MAKPALIKIPTEPIGSISRPVDLTERIAMSDSEDPNLAPLCEHAIRDTIERFEATGSPVVTNGEQKKYHNFFTYCVHGIPNTAPDLNNLAPSRFSPEERTHVGVPICTASGLDSKYSADVDYAELLPSLFELKAGNFYIALAGEPDRRRALKIIHKYLKPNQRIFVGVLAPIDQHIETPEEKSDRSFELGKNCRWC